jgi:hypothetical protein
MKVSSRLVVLCFCACTSRLTPRARWVGEVGPCPPGAWGPLAPHDFPRRAAPRGRSAHCAPPGVNGAGGVLVRARDVRMRIPNLVCEHCGSQCVMGGTFVGGGPPPPLPAVIHRALRGRLPRFFSMSPSLLHCQVLDFDTSTALAAARLAPALAPWPAHSLVAHPLGAARRDFGLACGLGQLCCMSSSWLF